MFALSYFLRFTIRLSQSKLCSIGGFEGVVQGEEGEGEAPRQVDVRARQDHIRLAQAQSESCSDETLGALRGGPVRAAQQRVRAR